jgi:uncharacterized protein (DUF305 family)
MNTSTPIRTIGGVTAAALGLILTACSSGNATNNAGAATGSPTSSAVPPSASASVSSAASPSVAAIPAATGPHNELDVMFARDMIPHHRQAVEMAALAETRASDQRVKDLAAGIKQAQDTEVTLMAGWLTGWGEPVPAPDQAHTAHGPGMMTHADMEDLTATSGSAFDRMFCDMMIRHHQGALEMAGVAKTQGQNPAVRALAERVVTTQTAEIAQLRAISGSR